jgi:hypothetical protein
MQTASFFPSLSLAPSISLRTKWMMPRHKILHPVMHAQTVYNMIQNLSLGSSKTCLVMTRHILVGQLVSQEKRNGLYFCTVSNKDWLLI